MKKKTFVKCSFLVLAVLAATVAIQAQGINSYRVHVPFDFVVGKHSYEAGDYLIRLAQQNALATILTVSTDEGRELQAAAVIKNGKTSSSDKTFLVFNRYGDNYVLRRISSPTFAFSAPRAGTATWMTVTKNLQKEPETVSVAMYR